MKDIVSCISRFELFSLIVLNDCSNFHHYEMVILSLAKMLWWWAQQLKTFSKLVLARVSVWKILKRYDEDMEEFGSSQMNFDRKSLKQIKFHFSETILSSKLRNSFKVAFLQYLSAMSITTCCQKTSGLSSTRKNRYHLKVCRGISASKAFLRDALFYA